MTGQAVRLSIQVISLVLMARLLSPKDYGLTAIIIALIGLGEIVRDFGLSAAAIQSETLSNQEQSNLFWMNTAIGTFLGCLLYMLAYPIAYLYHDDHLILIAQILSLTFVINGLSTQFKAGLTREMRFKALATSESLAAFISVGIGVGLAFAGFEYWAIVAQYLANYSFTLIFYVFSYKWLPSLPSFATNMQRFMKFGSHLMFSQILAQLARSVDTLIIGQRFNTEALGIYNRAQQVVLMALNQINSPSTTLAIPVLSKLKNDEIEYQRFLHFGQAVLTHVVSLFFGLMAVNANIVISLVLGEKWLPALPFVQILSIGAIFQVANYSSYWIFVSKGMTKAQLRFTIISRPFVVLMILIGSFWNIEAVAIGYAGGLCFLWLYCFYFLKKYKVNVEALFKKSLIICTSYIAATLFTILVMNNLTLDSVPETIIKNLIFSSVIIWVYISSSVFKETFGTIFKLNFLPFTKRK